MPNITWDILNHTLISSTTNSQEIQQLDWKLRDLLAINLYIVQPDDDTQSFIQQEAPAGFAVKFGLKHEDSLAGDFLAFQGSWAVNGSGSSAFYEATINLNTAELIADISTDDEKEYIGEFTFQNASEANQDTTQIPIFIKPDVIRGDEPEPTNRIPWLEEFDRNGQKWMRIRNSLGQVCVEFEPM